MKVLKDLLYKVNIVSTVGDMNQTITAISFDSRNITQGCLFIAISGAQYDGHNFVPKAIKHGAAAVVVERMPEIALKNETCITVKNSRKALGMIASNYYGNPSSKLKLVGITGTNGKTTVATLLYKLYSTLGYKTGLFSTICNRIADSSLPSTHTTMDAISLNEMFARMVEEGCSYCFMEVSSHAVDQHRIEGLHFAGSVFTNISHDHLDYHKTFQNYIYAKKSFFDTLSSEAFALINIDDKRSAVMVQNTKAKIKTFAIAKPAAFKAKIITSLIEGLELELGSRRVWFKLIGDFNAYNVLATYATAMLLHTDEEKVLIALSKLSVIPGRLERIIPNSKIKAIVDYAHTPDALKNACKALMKFRVSDEKIIVVIGCGGDRDALKRPLMAAVACKYSDKAIFTTDNPRYENPDDIIKDMQQGVDAANKNKLLIVVDREEAIKTACMIARENDIILVAGKGHEEYQDVKGKKRPFSDTKILRRILRMFANEKI